ncbi:peptidase inhibitor family I36 protein [Actinomadura sp. 6N118]|uniref:peptidase inhibitor family I36 protein n=1 Tax=Actinomadura sp. 6N118 TaxID=3375151 RepID=UPI00379D3376
MKFLRRLAVLALLAVAALPLSVPANAAPTTASAQTAYAPSCPSNRLCVWSGSYFSGNRGSYLIPDNSCVNFITPPKYSAYNRQSQSITLSEGTCANPGRSFYIDPGEEVRAILPNGIRSASRCSLCRTADGK